MGKRGRGFGAVYWRPDGRWQGQIRIPGGGRRSFYARTRRDVINRLSEARWALGQGLPVSAGTTSLATFFGRWLALTASGCGQAPSVPIASMPSGWCPS
jgi:hypothetical protein